ncbi:MAG: glycosyltransferase family 2 protein [Gemmatimonadota bacterium]|nr:glycosyltransferase family 2 protein [Gemmatimonadota bacterium]MDZ4865558.1 glycosyltransferase family 2 protein [Gemmatimonadota bacterium]
MVVLVPAHNEELHIRDCVRSLVQVDYPKADWEVIVVADNCVDMTAKLAMSEGAKCLERHDPQHPGKPQALVWAMAQLRLREFDAVVIIDADTVVPPDYALALAIYSPLRDVVLQSNFLVANEQENWLTRLGGVLSRCRYQVTYPLKQRAGLNCPLTGNGMCIGTGVLQSEGWQAFGITEDSELYAQFTAAGVPILHADRANLYSQEASSLAQGATQRRRWLAGRIGVLRQWGGIVLKSNQITWHQKLDLLVELGLSSPILHLAAAVTVAIAALATLPQPINAWIAAAALSSLVGLIIATVYVLWHHPEPGPTLRAFLKLPLYVMWRILLFMRTILTLGQTRWERTRRAAHTR